MLAVMSRVLVGRLVRLALSAVAAVVVRGLVELFEGPAGPDV